MRIFLTLLAFGALSFIQNMAFTWSSRSRNSGDPAYHRKAAWASNGVYWATNLALTLFIVQSQHDLRMLLLSGLIYVASTTEGSVLMMKLLLQRETGLRKVGAGEAAK